MRPAKAAILLFALSIFLPFQAKSADELKGYTPPPMFGGTSTPLSPPITAPPATIPPTTAPTEPAATSVPAVTSAPTPAPALSEKKPVPPVKKPAIVAKKPETKTVQPPADKEQVVKDEPLPIEPLTPRTPQKPTKPPSDKEKIPAYVTPVKKTEKSKTAELPVTTTPQLKPTPAPVIMNSGVSSESLLEHPVTSDTSGPAPDMKTLSAPVEDMAGDLPVPGGVAPKKKITDKKAADKKTEPKKVEIKKTQEKKPELKVTKVIPAPVKTKPVAAPALAKTSQRLEVKKESSPTLVAPTPALPLEKMPEIVKPDLSHAYTIKGKKSMPTAMPGKVESNDLLKAPLPPADTDPKLKSQPTANEQIIDQALQAHLVELDAKNIVASAPVAKDTKPFKNPVGKNPPPIIMMNNGNNKVPETVAATPALPEKIAPQLVSVEFKDQLTEVTPDMKKTIDESFLPKLKAAKSARLQILAYASPTKDGQSSARRISLARGLAIRTYMLEKGVEPGRIDIRALGENSAEKPLDRADLMIISYK